MKFSEASSCALESYLSCDMCSYDTDSHLSNHLFHVFMFGFGTASPGLSHSVNLEKSFNPYKAPLWRY